MLSRPSVCFVPIPRLPDTSTSFAVIESAAELMRRWADGHEIHRRLCGEEGP